MLKLNKLFYLSASDSDVFGDRILPGKDRRQFLVKCRNKIREHLRPAIRLATKTVLGMDKMVEPRFRTQGSWSYDTCVTPAHMPPQEMDWDYGVYLPVTVWEENGPPHLMAKAYFELVEGLLVDLCQREGWTMMDGKSTCIRLQVASWAHVDIPLYAAPEDEFPSINERTLVEARKSFDSARADAAFAEDSAEPQEWEELDHIVMATRDGEWRSSDPEAVAKWFDDRVRQHGDQLRRVCRYLKAWRDFNWPSGGPTSVSIMVAAAQSFDALLGRDDLAVMRASKKLGYLFLGEIRENGIDNREEDFNRLDAKGRIEAAGAFSRLATAIAAASALGGHQKGLAINKLQGEFGFRMPEDHFLIDSDDGAAIVRSTPAVAVAPPVIHSTKAG